MRGYNNRNPVPQKEVNKSQQTLNNISQGSGNPFMRRPNTLTCNGSICGREFGTKSLEIHQKTCIQNNLPNDHRRNMPSVQQMMQKVETEKQYRHGGRPQSGNDQIKGKGYYDYGAQPSAQMALAPCRRCGRRFNPDRIMKHESVCIGPEPDVARIKQQQIQQNQKAARSLRPKQTGKWRHEHREFVTALREMRKMDRNPPASRNQRGPQRPQQTRGYEASNRGGYEPQNRGGYDHRGVVDRGYGYPQTVVNSRKQPTQQPQMRTPPQKQGNNQQSYTQPKQVRAASSKPVAKNYSGGINQPAPYGRDPPKGMGGGGNYQISNSNVSTFSLFTGDGRPPDYSAYQRNNPYAKKNGIY